MQSQSRSRRAAKEQNTCHLLRRFFPGGMAILLSCFCFLGARYTLGEIEIQNYLKSLNPPSHEKNMFQYVDLRRFITRITRVKCYCHSIRYR